MPMPDDAARDAAEIWEKYAGTCEKALGKPHPGALLKHDSHYREIEAMGVEPMKVMEVIIVAGIPPEYHAVARRNLSAALEAKYLMRLGHKDDGEKELAKAANYNHRARTGTWM